MTLVKGEDMNAPCQLIHKADVFESLGEGHECDAERMVRRRLC